VAIVLEYGFLELIVKKNLKIEDLLSLKLVCKNFSNRVYIQEILNKHKEFLFWKKTQKIINYEKIFFTKHNTFPPKYIFKNPREEDIFLKKNNIKTVQKIKTHLCIRGISTEQTYNIITVTSNFSFDRQIRNFEFLTNIFQLPHDDGPINVSKISEYHNFFIESFCVEESKTL